ncbi:MAG: ATP-binding protein [Candidatus Eisenbacteria bacterium]
MAKLLDQITNGRSVAPRRLMLYGTHGVGKSTFASCAPEPIFIQTEDGLGEIECDKLPLSTTFGQAMQAMAELYTEKHEFCTVVVDSLDWLERLIWADVCHARNVESVEDIGYSKGYVFALTQWREFLEGLSALRNDRGMMIVLIAHARIERFENPETESYDRYVPRLHRLASQMVQEWCDEVFFASFKVLTRQSDEGFDRTRNRGIGTGERILRTVERPAHVAKNRLSLPEEMPLEWSTYAQYLTDRSAITSQPGKGKGGK